MIQHGEIRGYDDMHGMLRKVADLRNISRETIDELAGLPRGYASKVLAELPLRRLGPDTLGPMLGAMGVKLIAVDDPEALAKWTDRAAKREVKTALHSDTVEIKISGRKLKKMQRKGGANSRKYMTKKKARKLARRANRMRWHKPKLIEITTPPATHAADTSPAIERSAAAHPAPRTRTAGTGEP